ncbi:MAG TPA: hypothetical protein VFZ70_18130 [Euzebyales bacterium]
MSWERPPPRQRARRVLPIAVAGAAAVVAVIWFSVSRPSSNGTLPVGPTPAAGQIADPVDIADFGPEQLPPVAVTTEQPGDGALLEEAHALTVVAADDTGLQLLDVGTGDLERIEVRRPGRASLSDTLFTVAGSLIVDADNDVVAIPEAGSPSRIAANHRAIRTLDDDAVWVFDNFTPYVSGTASRVTLDGRVEAQVELPAVAEPLLGTDEGLIVGAPGAITFVSGDGDRRLIARGMTVATDGTRLAWLQCEDDLSCVVTIGTVDDPQMVRTALDPAVLPAGFFGLPIGTFSPDGRWLAMPLYRSRGRRGAEGVTVSVIDTQTGTETEQFEGSSLTPFDTPLAWSRDGRWLVFVSGADIHLWDATTGREVTLDVDLRGVRALAVR